MFIGINSMDTGKTLKTAFYLLLAIIILSALMGCVTSSRNQTNITVNWSEPDRLRFSGKGSGAGMMLMSSMGPAGIAVGVAIDEGIGKEIEGSIMAHGYDVKAAFNSTLEAALIDCRCNPKIKTLSVNRFGFKTFGSADFPDPISPEMQLLVTFLDGSTRTYRYPEDFPGSVALLPLEEAKVDGRKSSEALDRAISTTLASAMQ